ncbi:CBS domain-containing protein [Ponticaulis sp.]|uniref:CBS domain-containing protein n=1 Tax=Ponticaulis sp. TaxID=2020902 RepID=UPI000B71D761|nr:CBS domain-containing protein [Ponticaulis sp.]MAI90807.1 inosine-5-monophosphate dehydrogenase [Ponticaulis sp.]OUX99030.1 MAG: inosine-5-monophosphate dehydrogenase [Hyphomonadaceae bacterium TMED5]|tara:strand:+ start:88641 stop:89072 length:432 start_codon:yes stop_codon:yes gene_type:complete
MKLYNILNGKGRDVITLNAESTLQEAATILNDRKIGAAVAMNASGKLAGVLSERDIIRRISENGIAALSMTVSDAMTKDVITATPDTSIDEGLERMTDRRIRHLPIVEGGKLVGIVSIGDLVKQKISAVEAEAEAMKQYIHAG